MTDNYQTAKRALTRAAGVFYRYAKLHRAKTPPDVKKALVNEIEAKACELAISMLDKNEVTIKGVEVGFVGNAITTRRPVEISDVTGKPLYEHDFVIVSRKDKPYTSKAKRIQVLAQVVWKQSEVIRTVNDWTHQDPPRWILEVVKGLNKEDFSLYPYYDQNEFYGALKVEGDRLQRIMGRAGD